MPILLPLLLFAATTSPYDLVIRNGHVINGTGSPWYAADIAIRAGKIASVGRLAWWWRRGSSTCSGNRK